MNAHKEKSGSIDWRTHQEIEKIVVLLRTSVQLRTEFSIVIEH